MTFCRWIIRTSATFKIYPVELVVKDTTDSPNSASYLDIYLEHDINGTLTTKLYDKRDDFNFPIVNYPLLESNIPSSAAYSVYMSQLIRYSRTCNCPVNRIFYIDLYSQQGSFSIQVL